jgi:hypothetical protein
MAAQCCELKQIVRADGDETRALVNALNVQNLQMALADAKTSNIVLNGTLSQTLQTQTLLSAISGTVV